MNTRTAALTTLLALALGSPLAAQQPPKPKKPKWPKLSSSETRKAKARVTLVGLSGDEKETAKATEAEAELIDFGPGVAPTVLRRLGAQDIAELPDSIAALERILEAVCTTEHAPLIAERASERSPTVRRWSVGWLARHHLEEQRETLAAALDDDDATVSFRAGLGLLGLGDPDQLDRVLADCREDWRSKAALVDAVVSPARSHDMAKALITRIRNAPVNDKVTGLRLARSLCPEDYAGVLVTFLDDGAAPVKKEAINALRVVVDGDEPLENLSVFQAIDAAKKWKERIR